MAAEPSRFAPGETRWLSGLGSVRDVVRQTLVTRQILSHVDGERSLNVLDVGCGQATQAIALARHGHRVTGVDISEQMLDAARDAATAESPEVRARLRFGVGDALTGSLVSAARPGGLISLLTRNRAAIAMRAGMRGEWTAAFEGFDARHYTNGLGIQGARADDPSEVADTFRAAGATTVAWYGVRLFTDHWEHDRPIPADALDDLLRAEEMAAQRDPYRALAALTHTVAAKGTSG